MRIYKITDAKASHLEKQFDFIIVEPVNGAEFTSREYFDFVLPEYNLTGKLLSPSELGCSLSHISIYQKIIESDIPALIFEKDIQIVESEIKNAIQFCSQSQLDFIHLGWHPNVAQGVFFKGEYHKEMDLYRVDPYHNFHGTYAYYITPKIAKNLIEYHKPTIKKADSWARYFLNSRYSPYFKPIFTHPQERTALHKERLRIGPSVYNLSYPNLKFFLTKLIKQKFALLNLKNKSIIP